MEWSEKNRVRDGKFKKTFNNNLAHDDWQKIPVKICFYLIRAFQKRFLKTLFKKNTEVTINFPVSCILDI